jgi:hypothetical protein
MLGKSQLACLEGGGGGWDLLGDHSWDTFEVSDVELDGGDFAAAVYFSEGVEVLFLSSEGDYMGAIGDDLLSRSQTNS